MRFIRLYLLTLAALILCLARQAVAAPVPDNIGGQVRAEVDGRPILFPLLKSDIKADVSGDLASVTVVQTFVNPALVPLNATYLFPLNEDAAVHAMEMRVGDEVVKAKIARRDTARQTFEAAKTAGKAAALLQQQRPNMFTQDVANLMPGTTIVVTIEYVQTVPRIDGRYELVVPLIVGPRYMPNPIQSNVLASNGEPVHDTEPMPAQSNGQWSFSSLPDYPPVNGLTAPSSIDEDRVSIAVNLKAGVPIKGVTSATHAITTTGDETQTERKVTLTNDRTIDNRDFVLRYDLAGDTIKAGFLVHKDAQGGTFSLLIEPPDSPDSGYVTPREIVFLLDTSGSMGGAPIEASKQFMATALGALTPRDYFRVIRFANSASEFSTAPVQATPENLQQALGYVNSLSADGGTEVLAGLRQAFRMPGLPNIRRLLVFLSDGYVGNEAEILRMVAANIGQTRTYVFGIGTSVNRYLLTEMANVGHGLARIVDPTEKGSDAAITFAKKLQSTVMTDIAVDWSDVGATDVTPAAVPDLFAGDSIRIQGRFAGSGSHTIKVTGKVNGHSASLPLLINLPAKATGEATKAIPLIWARSQIADRMREIVVPTNLRRSGSSDAGLEKAVTDLGLAHSLVTQWTSFVSVSEKIVNAEPSSARDNSVNLPMVKGVGPGAYGVVAPEQRGIQASNPTTTQMAFSGAATPEPDAVGGLFAVLLSLIGLLVHGSLSMRASSLPTPVGSASHAK